MRYGGEPRGTPGPVVGRGARRDLPHLVGGGRPRGPMGAEPGRPAPRRRTSGPGYGRRRCRVLELSVRRRELTAALNRPRGRAEAPPGRRGAAAVAEEEASAGGWSGGHSWAHGVHLTEELPRPGARLHPGAPLRRPERYAADDLGGGAGGRGGWRGGSPLGGSGAWTRPGARVKPGRGHARLGLGRPCPSAPPGPGRGARGGR